MKHPDILKLISASLLVLAAAALLVRSLPGGGRSADKAFFYDLSEKKLFAASRTLVPPIAGVNNSERDAVRALVISTNGHPEDKTTWRIAYLEKYSPELKGQMEAAQQSGGSPRMSREEALAHRFVRRVEDSDWLPMNSPEAERIVTEWSIPSPGGQTAVICVP